MGIMAREGLGVVVASSSNSSDGCSKAKQLTVGRRQRIELLVLLKYTDLTVAGKAGSSYNLPDDKHLARTSS